jgi:hypothetical protein
VTDLEKRLQLPASQRYRCFHVDRLTARPCTNLASRAGADRRRGDALTFWCPFHAPEHAALIDPNQQYGAIELAAILTIGGSTVRPQDAKTQAVSLVQMMVTDANLRLTIMGSSMGLLTPTALIIPGSSRSDS